MLTRSKTFINSGKRCLSISGFPHPQIISGFVICASIDFNVSAAFEISPRESILKYSAKISALDFNAELSIGAADSGFFIPQFTTTPNAKSLEFFVTLS